MVNTIAVAGFERRIQMLGSSLQSFPKAALVAASLVLLVGATPSFADVAQQIAIARSGHATVPPSTQAQYLSPALTSSGNAGKCVGGYVWTQRSFSVRRTENQMALPMPCR
jgi:hypothetical protein